MQNGFGAFDALVNELSTSERRDMLEKLQSSVSVAWDSPDDSESGFGDDYVDAAAEFIRLPLWERVWIILLGIFASAKREDLVYDRLIRRRASELARNYPEIFSRKNNFVLSGFFQRVEGLAEALRPLAGPLSRALGRNEGAFLSILLGLEMESLQRELIQETDPFEISKQDPEMAEPEVKRRMNTNLDYAFESMPPEGRARMYDSARFLHALHRVAAYPFRSITVRALPSGDEGVSGCPVDELAEPLSELAASLGALQYRPSPRLMEAVFLFAEQERLNSEDYDVSDALGRRLRGAIRSLDEVRRFMNEVPISELCKIAYGDVNYQPKSDTGGEDWYSLVKRFWSERSEKVYREYIVTVKKRRVSREIERLLDSSPIQPLRNYRDVSGDEGRYARSLGALQVFFRTSFRNEMIGPLKTLLIDGEFYKGDNRSEYDEAFETLEGVEESISNFQQRLSEKGDLGMSLDQARRQPRDAEYSDRIKKAMSTIDERASEILKDAMDAMRSASDIIHGILYGEVGGRYDTIANLGQIGGRNNKILMASLDSSMRGMQAFLAQLEQLLDLEHGLENSR